MSALSCPVLTTITTMFTTTTMTTMTNCLCKEVIGYLTTWWMVRESLSPICRYRAALASKNKSAFSVLWTADTTHQGLWSLLWIQLRRCTWWQSHTSGIMILIEDNDEQDFIIMNIMIKSFRLIFQWLSFLFLLLHQWSLKAFEWF